ncbi:hypothetical protein LTR05_004808 [Lithohypha guttulata]|uniref:Fungal N-terminal domain-containing protein n=1 Tax=Lithohypha guttulata TaxID=1690604 RepID=A0AAN7SYY5_9EURO|nr:hypothetical protein LTR05_004808 [Lithohypha guttulata]
MADPLSVLVMVNASMGIARSLIHTIKELYEIAEQYETAALGIRTVATQCTSFRIAIERIHKWLVKQSEENRHDLDEDFWQALKSNLDTGNMVIKDLNRRIHSFRKSPAKFWTRTKYLWNHVVISELQSQIQGLMSALGLLINVIDLSARIRVEEQRSRQLAAARNSDGLENDLQAQSEHSDTALVAALRQPSQAEFAPPPYHINNEFPTHVEEKPPSRMREATPEVAQDHTSLSFLTQVKSHGDLPDKKTLKRPTWKNFMKRSNKSEPPRSMSDPIEQQTIPEIETKHTSTVLENTESMPQHRVGQSLSDTKAMPAKDENFDLLNALAGMSVEDSHSAFNPLSQTQSNPTVNSHPHASPVELPEVESPDTMTATHRVLSNNNPYLAMRLTARSRSDFGASTSVHTEQRDEVDQFSRTRPSHSIASPPLSDSLSQTPSCQLGERLSSFGRSSHISLSPQRAVEQSWQTIAITNRTTRLKVKFEKELFSNKMSASAARALGVDNSIIIWEGVPLTNLTMLYTVSDGTAVEDTIVNGEEVEFEVMNEHESRVPELYLGQGVAHFVNLMEGGDFIYWNPGAVPKNLRSVNRLRSYRRFELVR